MHPASIPASAVPSTKTIPVFEATPLFLEFSVFAWALFANCFFIVFLSFFFVFFSLRCIREGSGDALVANYFEEPRRAFVHTRRFTKARYPLYMRRTFVLRRSRAVLFINCTVK